MDKWIYGALLVLILTSTALGVEATDAKKEAKVATCKTEQLEKELEKAKDEITDLRKQIEELRKAVQGKTS